MSNNELVTFDLNALPVVADFDDSVYEEMFQSSTEFLSQIRLYTKGQEIDRGRIRPGHYGIKEGEELIDLGDSVDVIPYARRLKALDWSDKNNTIVSYDPFSDEFQRIRNQADEQGSNCACGGSFLLFERSTGRFLELFLGNKTGRPEGKKIVPFLPLSQAEIEARKLVGVEPHGPIPVTLKSRLIQKQFSWHVPVIVRCSVPFDNCPSSEVAAKEIVKFKSQKSSSAAVVTPAEAPKRRTR